MMLSVTESRKIVIFEFIFLGEFFFFFKVFTSIIEGFATLGWVQVYNSEAEKLVSVTKPLMMIIFTNEYHL